MHFLETRIPPLAVAIIAVAMAVITDVFWLDSTAEKGMVLYSICALLLLAAAVIGRLSVKTFLRSETTLNPMAPEKALVLVDSGIYAYTRNPMYLALGLIVLAISAYFTAWWSLLFTLFYAVYLTRFQIIPEERALDKIFGEAYRHYKNKVRRWL